MHPWLLLNINRKARDRFAVDFFIHRRSRLSSRANQWRNDGVAVASRDGGPTGKGAPDSSRVLND